MTRKPNFTHNDLDDFRGVGLVVLPILVSDEPADMDDATGRGGAA
ncbi:hypothetical protein [Microbacterium enclense]